MDILAISGSLRAASVNSAFCRAVARLAPDPAKVSVFTSITSLPLFNPDLESNPPSSAMDFRAAVGRANALLLASPKYVHGVTGAMKNGLDSLVSFDGFMRKPVAIINTSPRAQHAYASLKEILQTMSATILPKASLTIPLLGTCTTEEAMLGSLGVRKNIQTIFVPLAASLSDGGEADPIFQCRELRLVGRKIPYLF
jgi:chromate reductase, NAD(P)H dehydrogenase (quinone)